MCVGLQDQCPHGGSELTTSDPRGDEPDSSPLPWVGTITVVPVATRSSRPTRRTFLRARPASSVHGRAKYPRRAKASHRRGPTKLPSRPVRASRDHGLEVGHRSSIVLSTWCLEYMTAVDLLPIVRTWASSAGRRVVPLWQLGQGFWTGTETQSHSELTDSCWPPPANLSYALAASWGAPDRERGVRTGRRDGR